MKGFFASILKDSNNNTISSKRVVVFMWVIMMVAGFVANVRYGVEVSEHIWREWDSRVSKSSGIWQSIRSVPTSPLNVVTAATVTQRMNRRHSEKRLMAPHKYTIYNEVQ